MSHYIHHVPGRLRIQATRLRSLACAQSLSVALAELPGVSEHRHNAKAGSVLIHYDADQLGADDILYHLRKAGCLDSGVSLAARQAQGSGLVRQAGMLFGNALFGTLLRKSVETSVLSLAKGLR